MKTPHPTPLTDRERYAAEIAALVAKHGEVPPLWAMHPRTHPADIAWRMGGGEDYRYLFSAWAAEQTWSYEERLAYVRRWDPPYSWLEWVAHLLWPDELDDDNEPTMDPFEALEALGLGTRADWERCSSVGPDEYPLADDVSSRWLER